VGWLRIGNNQIKNGRLASKSISANQHVNYWYESLTVDSAVNIIINKLSI